MEDKKAALDPSRTSMESQTFDLCNDDDDEQILDHFQCSICLDLLYKPVVIACGHVSCFWCVHKSMSGIQQSHCPKCRRPYYHFPSICRQLHSVIAKLHPVAYKRREMEVLKEENDADCFSPQFDDRSDTTTMNSQAYHASPEESNLSEFVDQLDCDTCHDEATNIPRNSNTSDFEGNSNMSLEENKLPENGRMNGICKQVSIGDVLCVACKQLLLRPTVLHCGHVYCEACVPTPKDEIIRCKVCQNLHPGGFPKVCLEFNNFLVEQLSEEYTHQRKVLHDNGVSCQQKGSSACAAQDDFSFWWHEHGSKAHFGAGCDSCGMYPIIGKRYRCMDCKEAIGFDLCGDCYSTPSKLPGRFNQQHTPEHRFELVPRLSVPRYVLPNLYNHGSYNLIGIMSRPEDVSYEDVSDSSNISNDAPEESENMDSTT